MKGLSTGGSTNTLAALKLALADPQCHAIYLLTDGRPDQVQYMQIVLFCSVLVAFNEFYSNSNRYSHDGLINQPKDKAKTCLIPTVTILK